jgi:hypothetical protein
MPSDESKSALVLEFEEFQRKFEAAVRLTWSDLRREAEKVLDAARHQRTGKVRALPYFLDMLLGQATIFVLQNFKPIAAMARRSSSANLLSSNHLFQEVLHGAPHYITAGQDSLALLCELYESPTSAASFNERFRLLFAEKWERLVCEAELEATPLPPTQVSESADAVDEEESATERRRRTQQIGDRVVSHLPPRSGVPGAPSDGVQVDPSSSAELVADGVTAKAQEKASMLRRMQSSPEKALQILIEYVKTTNPKEKKAKAILKASDAVISGLSEGERVRVRKLVHAAVPDGWKDGIVERPTLVEYWNRRQANGAERRAISTYVFDVAIRLQ